MAKVDGPINFFSFFTNVSNLFGAIVLLALALDALRAPHQRDVVRGAATLCLAIVGVVFSSLLANLESDIIPWVNAIVHYFMPAAIVADWCFDPPSTALTRSDVARWLILPVGYGVYTLVRGAVVHWYPYPFINVDTIGYSGVALYMIVMIAFALLTSWVLSIAGVRLRARRNAS